jgi:dipeptidase E
MHLYLSSFRIGNRASELQELADGRRLGFVPNALDFVPSDRRTESNAAELRRIRDLGLEVEPLDLSEFFGAPDRLSSYLDELQGVWIRGGNTFVLRRAMRLSGFDQALLDRSSEDFLYAGYSAGICVLAPSLDGLQHVDDPTLEVYPGTDVVWEGLGILDYLILPHYKSDHPESADIEIEVEYCTRNSIPFKTLRDGEVLVFEGFVPPRSA